MAATQQFGLTPQGYIPMRLQDIATAMNTNLQNSIGSNISLGPESVFGQIVAITSAQLALVWELGLAIYSSQYPAGAEGTSVDNILALTGLYRLPATATVTSPTENNIPGLVVTGTAGTVIPAGSLIAVDGNPLIQFSLDAAITIAAQMSCIQLINFTSVPTQGGFNLSIVDQAGNTINGAVISWNSLANQTQITWASAPTSGSWYIGIGNQVTTILQWNSSASAIQSAIQALTGYSGATVSGTIAGGSLTITWGAIANPIINVALFSGTWGTTPTMGTYELVINGTPTAAIPYNATAAQVQSAINAVPGYDVTQLISVTGSYTSGYKFNWGNVALPSVSVTANSTGQTFTYATLYTLNQNASVAQSVQATINSMYDSVVSSNNQPYSDVQVSGQFSTGFTVTFGAGTPTTGNSSSGNQPQNTFSTFNNTLQMGAVVTNVAAIIVQAGSVAQGTGSATCTQTGPNTVLANTLSVIVSSISGWSTVNNPLDCITGQAEEDDTQALIRRSNLLAINSNGTLQGIVAKVEAVSDVTAVIGFQNRSMNFDFSGGTLVSTTGNLSTTSQVISGMGTTVGMQPGQMVSDSANSLPSGTVITQILSASSIQVNTFPLTNQSGDTLNISGLPPKSFNIVVQGGANSDIAKAIYGAEPAGIEPYGNVLYNVINSNGFVQPTYFSRPSAALFYVAIALVVNPSLFPSNGVQQIQEDIVSIGNAFPIGGTVIGFGTDGLIGAFNSVPGIISYTLFFGLSPNPVTNTNVQLSSQQMPLFESFNVIISIT